MNNKVKVIFFLVVVVLLVLIACRRITPPSGAPPPPVGIPPTISACSSDALKSSLTPERNTIGKTWYVSHTGNDGNTGTQEQPLKTITQAVSKLKSGDILYVMPGDYRSEGTITITKKIGSKTAPITIAVEPGATETPTVQSFRINDSQWVEISGFTVIGPKTLPAKWRDMPDVVVDDPSIEINRNDDWESKRKKDVAKKYATYTEFKSWDNQRTSGFAVESSNNIVIRFNDISLHSNAVSGDNAVQLLIEGNTIHHVVDGIWGNLLHDPDVGMRDSLIVDNTMTQLFRQGVSLTKGIANVVENNTIQYSGHSHIITWHSGENNVIRNNTVMYGGYYTETMEFPGGSAISIHSAGSGTQVIGNYIAYHYDATLGDGNGVIVDINPNGALVANNLIYRVQGSGISVTKSSNVTAVHNTIIEPGYNTPSQKNGVGFRTTSNKEQNNIFANNIVYRPKIGGMYFALDYNGNLNDQAYIGHNLFMLNQNTPLAADGRTRGQIYFDVASFQQTGYGQGTLIADPQFVNNETDFRLLPTSPAIAAGTAQYAYSVDKDCKPRNTTKPSMGAFE